MGQYPVESACPGDTKEYKIISVGGLWAEQFSIEIGQIYHKLSKFQISQFFSILKSVIKCVDFNLKLLSSQITHRRESVLFRIVRATPFHRVLTHFCERSVSQANNQIVFGPGRPPPRYSGRKNMPILIELKWKWPEINFFLLSICCLCNFFLILKLRCLPKKWPLLYFRGLRY